MLQNFPIHTKFRLDKFIVEVDAKRRGLNWKTNRLTLKKTNGQEIKFI